MTNYPLINILLPAVVISSTIFSSLTLPFVFNKSKPIEVGVKPFFSLEVQPIFHEDHKDLAIPYLGVAILVSVLAGLGTVEVGRQWQKYQASVREKKRQLLQEIESLNQGESEPEYQPDVSAIALTQKDDLLRYRGLTPPNTQSFAVQQPHGVVDSNNVIEFKRNRIAQTTGMAVNVNQLKFYPESQNNNSVQLRSSPVPALALLQDLELSSSHIIKSRQDYQICWINVPHLSRRLLAINVDGQYYSFLRLEKTQEQLIAILSKVADQLDKIVITHIDKGYVIWNWEPEVLSNN
ncbi:MULTISPECIES: TetR family transcriptional regulator [unclassified Moorena]|uniref:TetR family transcriptional regulator n=1 Tax=unclassified Moorena TaxID=2683338 RepID=UPI0013C6963E|nr:MULTISPECIES: TetR family transcriptional regulator [unclassified Moorena]NEO20766.1 TetR family transcriptional regulator [Moorena sp. SIO4A5]NEQ60060.1 TetR family transcriptional regulator [Moorena sp. SIO4A1]